jgi:hypothetical protein
MSYHSPFLPATISCDLPTMHFTKQATTSALDADSKDSTTTVYADQEKGMQVFMGAIEKANARYCERVGIQMTTDQRGWGLCALTTFQKGDFVMRGTAIDQSAVQTKHSVQSDWDSHVEMDLPARFINHICNDANVGVKPNEVGAYDFYALREIAKDEELLWDYEATEYQIEEFSCSCGSSTCRGELKGFKVHGQQLIEAYGKDFIAPYLLRSKEYNISG